MPTLDELVATLPDKKKRPTLDELVATLPDKNFPTQGLPKGSKVKLQTMPSTANIVGQTATDLALNVPVGLMEGAGGLSQELANLQDYAGKGISKVVPGYHYTPGLSPFQAAAETFNESAQSWKNRQSKENVPTMADTIVTGAGELPAAYLKWQAKPLLTGIMGAANESARGGSGLQQVGAGALDYAQRLGLGKATEAVSGIKNPLMRRGLNAVAFGTADIVNKAGKSVITGENQLAGIGSDTLAQMLLGGILSGYKPEMSLGEVRNIAQIQKAIAIEKGDIPLSKQLGKIADLAADQAKLQEQGGGFTKSQITGNLGTQKAEAALKESLVGGKELQAKMDVANPQAVQNIQKQIADQPIKGQPQQLPEIVARNTAEQLQQKLIQGQQNVADMIGKTGQNIYAGEVKPASQLTSETVQNINAIHDAAETHFKKNAAQISQKIAESPLNKYLKTSMGKQIQVSLGSLKNEARQNSKKSYIGGNVATTTSDTTTKAILEHPSYQAKFVSFEDAIIKRSEMLKEMRTLSDNNDKTGVSKIKRYVNLLDNSIKIALKKAGPEIYKLWRQNNADYKKSVQLTTSDIAFDIRGAQKENSGKLLDIVTASPEAANTGKVLLGAENWKHIQKTFYNSMITDATKTNPDSTTSLQGNKLLAELGKQNPETLKAIYSDNPQTIDTIKKIGVRAARIDASPLRKMLGQTVEDLKTNPTKAAYDLLTNPNIDQPIKLRAVQKTIGKDEYAQLQSRMIESLERRAGSINKDIGGRVVKGLTLGEMVNQIPESNWRAAFPNNPNIKNDLLQLDRIATRTQKPLEQGGKARIGYVLESAPLVTGLYRFLSSGSVKALAKGVGLESGVSAVERIVAHHLANPNTAKLLLRGIEATEPSTIEKISKKLAWMTKKDLLAGLKTEDNLLNQD